MAPHNFFREEVAQAARVRYDASVFITGAASSHLRSRQIVASKSEIKETNLNKFTIRGIVKEPTTDSV